MFPLDSDFGPCITILSLATPTRLPFNLPSFVLPMLMWVVILLVYLFPLRFSFWWMRRRASRLGYPNRLAYLNAIPMGNVELQDAVDLLCKGAILCVLGVMFRPLILCGVMPLYYGGRKLAMAVVGLRAAGADGATNTAK